MALHLEERYRFYMRWALSGSTTLDGKWKYYPSVVARISYSCWADFNHAQVLLIKMIEGDCDE